MRRIYILCLLGLFFFSGIQLYAYHFQSGGIYYNIIDDNTVTVTSGKIKYEGDISIPERVTYDGDSYNVTSIGGSAFLNCSGLTSITIPNSVISIGYAAFRDCSGLTSITIPSSVTSIEGEAFANCSGLTSITIPFSVTSIGYGAFSGCSGLTSMTFLSSVTSIENYTFSGCSGLTSITIPFSVTSIGPGAFSGCSGLTSIMIPSSVASIGYAAFSDCSGLTSISIPNSVTSIHDNAFENCSGFSSITIPSSVTSIDGNAFKGCSGLTSIKVESGNTMYDSRNNCNAIIRKSNNELIAGCKNTVIPNSVTIIGRNAFAGCGGLNSISIPSSVTSIGNYAFSGCGGLTFIMIPNSVTSIGDGAFSDCSDLTSITIPNSVTSIGSYAFFGCSGLSSISIPNSVTSIGNSAFRSCSGLTSIKVESENTIYDSRNDCNAIIRKFNNELIAGCKNTVIPNSVTRIGGDAFSGCSGLNSIRIPNSVTSIGNYAFSGCGGLKLIMIPNSVTSIDYYAFSGCSGLTSIVSEIVKPFAISGDVFSDYSKPILTVPSGTKSAYQSTAGWNKFTNIIEASGDITSTKRTIHVATAGTLPNLISESEKYTIEELTLTGELNGTDFRLLRDMGGVGVKYLDGQYEYTNGKLKFLDISKVSIKSGGSIFLNYKYKEVEKIFSIDNDNEISSMLFYGCKLERIELPNNVTSIGSSAFENCGELTSITIPKGVTAIGSGAFCDCKKLEFVSIPSSVITIGVGMTFSGCHSLTSIDVDPDNSHYQSVIGVLFNRDKSILVHYPEGKNEDSYKIPNGVTTIESRAFESCKLSSVLIPNSVASIGIYAFWCNPMTVISEIEKPFPISTVFYSLRESKLIVPKGTKEVYLATYGWDSFGSIEETTENTSSTKRTIHVATAGTLPDLIPESEKYTIEELTLTGELNGTDFRLLRDMAGNNYKGKPTEGRLKILDLSEIRLKESGESFLNASSIMWKIISTYSYGFNSSGLIEDPNSIPECLFIGCTSLVSVSLPKYITGIGGDAFKGCGSLTTITIPPTVNTIGTTGGGTDYTFFQTPWYDNQPDGLVYAGKVLYRYKGEMPSNTSLIIDEGTTGIADYAFDNCKGLTNVSFPNGLISIGKCAFRDCSNLTTISIPNSVSHIGYGAFKNTPWDEKQPNGIVYAGKVLYRYKGEMKLNTTLNIEDGIIGIADDAFYGYDNLVSVSIPASVSFIGRAFNMCSNLLNIRVDYNNSNYLSISGILFDKNYTKLLCYPAGKSESNYTVPEGIKRINSFAFYGCKNLESIVMPQSVEIIGIFTFYGCTGLKSLKMSDNIVSIPLVAISGTSLVSINIPQKCKFLGRDFMRCPNLNSVIIPNNIIYISDRAFIGCSGLTSIISEVVNPFEISEDVFSDYSKPTLTVPSGTKSAYQSTAGWKKFTNIVEASGNNTSTKRTIHVATAGTLPNLISESEKYTIEELKLTGELNGTDFRLLRDMAGCDYNGEETVGKLTKLDITEAKIVVGGEKYLDTDCIISHYVGASGSYHYDISQNNEIPKYVFSSCYLEEIRIPNSVTSIGEGAFFYCRGLAFISIPNSVTTIGNSAFEGCDGLTSISIPNSVTSIGDYAFEGCTGLASISIPNSVTSIGSFAFSSCRGLTSISIPNSVTSIGIGIFSFCSGLTSIKVESGNTIYDSRNNCNAIIRKSNNELIAGCKNTVISNSVTSIGSSAFYYCSDLTSISIPNSVTSIGDYAFFSCTGLASISIPNSVTSIGSSAFSSCRGLTSISIPNSVMSIGIGAFSSCRGLTSIKVESGNTIYDSRNNCNAIIRKSNNELIAGCKNTVIPNSVTSIGEATFLNCRGLTSIIIPNSVTSIGDYAFSYCSGLKDIISEIKTPFEINENVFSVYSTATLTVPNGTKSAYQSTAGWKKFANIKESTSSEVRFTQQGITYLGTTSTLKAEVRSVNDDKVEIPATVVYNGSTYDVTSVADGVLSNRMFDYVSLPSTITSLESGTFSNSTLGALIWNANTSLPSNVISNMAMPTTSNFLLYVNKKEFAPSNVSNVVVGNTASSIILKDGIDTKFYCPKSFTAQTVSYTHHYGMMTGGNGKGWETIALPFDVQKIEHKTKGVITPFASYQNGSGQRPFWLYEFGSNGFRRTDAIKANTPYIISMPNDSKYDDEYNLAGDVTFSATNATVVETASLTTSTSKDKTFIPAFAVKDKVSSVYALNVSNELVNNSSSNPGSEFVSDLRRVYPFEAYMTTSSSSTRSLSIVFDDGTTGVDEIPQREQKDGLMTVYTLTGMLLLSVPQSDFAEKWQSLPSGVYIVNGQKMIKSDEAK